MDSDERKIIHIDMDAFFASVEQRDHPEYRGLPLAVGFDGPRGVVSTASYEARRFGVHSAMSIAKAKQLCPQLVIVSSRHEYYQYISGQVHDIFREYTDLIEPISIDEAFLDVTHNKKDMPFAQDIANEIREKIKRQLNLTASAGVSYNKLLAKIASDYNKPDGIFVVRPEQALDFIGSLNVEKIWGVGPKTAKRMHAMGIFTGSQLRQVSLAHLREVFGKMGGVFYDFARGIDNRPVETEWTRKSVGCEQTFLKDLHTHSAVIIELYHVVIELVERIRKNRFEGRTLTLKVRYADFTQITRSITQDKVLTRKQDILATAKLLLKQVDISSRGIRLLGLTVSMPSQASLEETHERWVEGFLQFRDP